jgi:glycosyltransferase involved in cell wall biosynthesis
VLEDITPVILTFDEEPNIERTLAQLSWAGDVVIVDSLSTDRTLEIAGSFPGVRIFQRAFDTHAEQWNFAIEKTGIKTRWILALDADYVLTPDFIDELRNLTDVRSNVGYSASFRYCIQGIELRGSLYPPATVLFRRGGAHYVQDGHTQRLKVSGTVEALKAKINLDDRKSLSRWLWAQDRYMRLECEHIAHTPWSKLTTPDKIRRFPLIAPFIVFLVCYLGKGGFLDGKAGLYYAFQRLLAETLLALRLIEVSKRW